MWCHDTDVTQVWTQPIVGECEQCLLCEHALNTTKKSLGVWRKPLTVSVNKAHESQCEWSPWQSVWTKPTRVSVNEARDSQCECGHTQSTVHMNAAKHCKFHMNMAKDSCLKFWRSGITLEKWQERATRNQPTSFQVAECCCPGCRGTLWVQCECCG